MNTIDAIKSLVSQMTPTFCIDAIVDVSATSWKLETCATYWLMEFDEVEIDGETYKILSIEFNDHIIIQGANKPTVSSFVIPAPHFDYGTHRKVNDERSLENQKELVTPFVYLMEIMRERQNFDEDSPIERTSDLRLFFLGNHNQDGDTLRETLEQQVIKPMHSMCDVFVGLILDQEHNFERPSFSDRYSWPLFGVPAVWGNKEPIFDEPLSGVELKISLDIRENLGCNQFCSCD